MLTLAVVKGAQAGPVEEPLPLPAPGAIDEMVVLEIAARGASWRRASPPVALVDGFGGPVRGARGIVPGRDELLDQREHPDP